MSRTWTARAFYEAVFQGELTRLEAPDGMACEGTGPEMWAFPMEDGSTGAPGALIRMPGMDPAGSGTMVYFSCDDCAEEAARVLAAGGQLQREKFSIEPYGFVALAIDTEGNMIGLHSRA